MRSMTGYGQARVQREGRSLQVEVRSVNQRFLECKLNLPREYLPFESELRALVQAQVERGKVDVSVGRAGTNGDGTVIEPNIALARAYVDAWRKLHEALGLPPSSEASLLQARASELLRVVERPADPSGDLDFVREAVERALKAFNREREREGKVLGRDMKDRIKRLQKLHKQIQARVKLLKPAMVERLRQRVADLLSGREIKEERLLQEVALVAERADVTEELVRLGSHLQALLDVLAGDGPVGKKIDFLLQETHREFNTIASKSNDLEVTQCTLEARGEVEKLREQVQNLE